MLAPGHRKREVGRPLRVVPSKHPLGHGGQLVLELAGRRLAHGLHDAVAGDAGDLALHGDLARALAHRITSRIGSRSRISAPGAIARTRAMNAASREGRPSHGSVAVETAWPIASAVDPPPAHLRTKRGVDGPSLLSDARQHASSASRATTASMPVMAAASGPASKVGSVVALAPGRLEQERGLFRAPVEDEDGARHLDAGEVEELVVLPEDDLRRHLGRAMHHRDAVADRRQHLRAAGGKLLEREGIGEIHGRRALHTHERPALPQ